MRFSRQTMVEGAAGIIQGLYVMAPACLAVLASVRAVQGAWSDAVIVAAALLAYLFQSAVLRSEIAEHRVTTRCCADLRQAVADITDENRRLRGGSEKPWAPEEISALQELLARTGARLAAAETDAEWLAKALRKVCDEDLGERLLDAQQDINYQANCTMAQSVADASQTISELDAAIIAARAVLASYEERKAPAHG